MEVRNPLYKNIGIHVICSLFTVDNGEVKILLIRRKNEPFKDKWALIGGALYNNETIEDGLQREIYEKTGLKNIKLFLSNVESEINRSPIMRMIALNYVGIIDVNSSILKDTKKTSNAEWFNIEKVKELAYDHNKILDVAKDQLKKLICNSNILSNLFPDGFTMPEIQMVYESILDKDYDRRNFRKKLINSELIIDTNKTKKFEGNKPAKIYKFKDKISDKNVF